MLLIAETPGEVWERAAAWLADAVRETVMTRGRCTLALSGGTTPREVYHRLSALPVPWNDVEIFFGDERAVPPGSAESNYHMAEESLLARIPVSRLRVHRMEAERSDLGEVAAEYERLLPEAIDILILGIGADGHIASLFPHAPALQERERLVMPVVGGEPLIQRLTITPPVIERAIRVLVIATGAEKAAAVAGALRGPEDPAAVPARLARRGTWIVDRAAAGSLQESG